MYSACHRHVYAEGLPKSCGSNAEGFSKHPEAMRKMQRTPDWTPKASRRLAYDAEGLLKGCRRVPEGLPKGSRRPSRIKHSASKILNFLKVQCRRYFDPESAPKATEGTRKGSRSPRSHAQGMPKVVNSQMLPSGTLREPFGVLVETRLNVKPD